MKKRRQRPQLLLIAMRISFYQLLLAGLFAGVSFANNADAQELLKQKVSIHVKNQEIKNVLKELDKTCDVHFTYAPSIFPARYRVNIQVSNKSLGEVLDELLTPLEVSYQVDGQQVILQKEKSEPDPTTDEVNNATSLDKQIRGTVKDEKGELLAGVTIMVKGSNQGTVTDAAGSFALNLSDTDLSTAVLVFSFVGYQSTEVPASGQTVFDIALQPSVNLLEQVVVTGYGSKKAKYLSSSVAVIPNEKLRDVTSNELSSLLQGKAPGVVVSTSSGDPTSGSNILIRGAGTISASTAPLIIVDGNIGGSYNPTDIESVTVLKDAAATGLYGSRAANGVIIITTKMGKAGKTKIDFSTTLGFAEATTGNFKLMNSQQLYDYQKTFYDRDPSIVNTNTDWWDLAFRKGFVNSYTLSASGGTEKTQFYVSGNYYKEQGTVLENDKTGYNFRSNITSQLTKKLKLSVLFNGIFTQDNYENSGTLYDAYVNMPFDAAYDADGSPIDGRTATNWQGRDRENFLHSLPYNYSKARSLNVNTDVNLDYAITPKLTFSTYNRVRFFDYKDASYYDKRTKQGGANGGELYNSRSYTSRILTSNRLRYEESFGLHNLAVLAVGEAERNYYDDAAISGKGLPPGRDVMSVATDIINNPTGGNDQYSFSKYLAQADYNFDNRYFAIASFVHEYSSKFGSNNPAGNFYQLGGSWIVSNENFMKEWKTISFLKFRASYGTVGNADGISNYAALGLYSISQDASYAGLPGAAPSQKGNPDLSWEKMKTANIGAEIGLFNNRLDVTVDAYEKKSSALLYKQPLQATTGYSYRWVNAGAVRNRGMEFSATSKNIVGAFNWETNLNVSFNRNKVLELSDGAAVFNSGARQPIAVGHNMDEWNLPIWAGVDPQNGDPLWEKIVTDADGAKYKVLTNSYSSVATAQSRQFTGTSAAPKFTGGLSNTFSYKGITLSTFFNFVYGNEIYNNSRAYFDNDGLYESYNAMVLAKGWSRWEKPGDVATHPKPIVGGNHDSNQSSSRYLEDGSYIRLRNIKLSYALPAAWLGKSGISNLNVFLSGDNLWTATKFSGPDPEVSFTQTDLSSGVSSFKYPISKKFLCGVNISF